MVMQTQAGGPGAFARFDLNRVPSPAFVVDEVAVRRNLAVLQDVGARADARVLLALEWAMAWAGRPEEVRRQAERRLLLPAGPIRLDGDDWHPAGLASDGGLRLVQGPRERVLHRCFGAG